eukprot:scaffold1350_cov249-Pinguiococcus_pyrenoidosus.AAC.10
MLLALLLIAAPSAFDAFQAPLRSSARAATWKRHALAPATESCAWAAAKFGDAKDSVSDASTMAAALRDVWLAVEEMLKEEEGEYWTNPRTRGSEKIPRSPRSASKWRPAPRALPQGRDAGKSRENGGVSGASGGLQRCVRALWLRAVLLRAPPLRVRREAQGGRAGAAAAGDVQRGQRRDVLGDGCTNPRETALPNGAEFTAGGADDDAWDDDWDLDLPDGEAQKDGSAVYDAGAKLDPEGLSDAELVEINKRWVQSVVAGLGVCPFATSSERAGLPLGEVAYPIVRCTDAETMYKAFWSEVARLQDTDERSLSTTMLVAPSFCLRSADSFDVFSTTLTRALEPLAVDEGDLGIQLVFFHPGYEFRDGADRMQAADSDSQAARDAAAGNFARRSPHPMINILRTPQVRAAQRVIPTGAVYVQNQRTLGQVGTERLQDMLEQAEWEGLQDYKVDRREGLWKRAAKVTEAVEAAEGSREGLEDIDFDDDKELTVAADKAQK